MTGKNVVKLSIGLLAWGLIGGESVSAMSDSFLSDVQANVKEGNPSSRPPLFGKDPEDPDNQGTATGGLLTIDRVPNLMFGRVVASGLYQREYAVNSNPYLQVSDLRGSLGGWTVSAKISDFVSQRTPTDTSNYILGGASLSLQGATVEEYQSEYAGPPTSYPVHLNKDYQKVLAAAPDSGQGIWSSRWKSSRGVNDNIELAILPGTAEVGRDYQATISWKLSDVPNK